MAETFEVAVVEDVWGPPFDRLAAERAVLRAPDAYSDRDRLVDLASRSRVLVVRNRTSVDSELLERAEGRLGLIARAGSGLDNIALDAARTRGINVAAPVGLHARSVAEHTIALALSVIRHVTELDRGIRAGRWERRWGRELHGRCWGLWGLGATGLATARLVNGFGVEPIACDPFVSTDDLAHAELPIRLVDRDELLASAHFLSIHLPLTPATQGMLDADALRQMRDDAVLINVGRGEIVDEDAVADALESGRLLGAAFDVRAEEPPTPGRLETLERVVLTPHVAGLTLEAQERIMEALADDITAFLSGDPLRHCVV